MDKQRVPKCSTFLLSFISVLISAVLSLGPLKPMPIEYAISRVTQRQKDQFVDEHNKYRSLVYPPAANMEYMFWNDDLANLAQMWANKCIWDHGFLEFGEMYPNAPFKGQVGQNLARDWSRLHNPADRVKLWYQESSNYTFSRFSTPIVPNQCSKPPCKRYTQLVWATTKYVGCGISFCDKSFSKPHPWIRGETEVVCDYAPGGNAIDQFPYDVGKPCSKCASGKGFCYKNLCRDCDDFDPECGKSLTLAMCPAFKDMMAKKCPKMCNLCECPLECQNGGKLNPLTCTRACPHGWTGLDCSDAVKSCPSGFYGENCQFQCIDRVGQEVCRWRISNGHQCSAAYMKQDCAALCGLCGQTAPRRKPSSILTKPKPLVIQTTPKPSAHLPIILPSGTRIAPSKTVTVKSPSVSMSSNLTSTKPPAAGYAYFPNTTANKVLSIAPPVTASNVTPVESPRISTNKPSSVLPLTPSLGPFNVTFGRADQTKGVLKFISSPGKPPQDKSVTHCKDNNIKCPYWALAGECTRDRTWMLANCRRSCNQCGVCRDAGPKCAALALLDKCITGDKSHLMLTNCRQNCGLCQVYDRRDHCPAWAARDECKKYNWTWMRDNCPSSCRIPLSEVQFCADKEDGNYAIPRICTGYVACSGGVTRHELCPNGTLFNPLIRFCDLPQNVKCSQERQMTLKKSHISR